MSCLLYLHRQGCLSIGLTGGLEAGTLSPSGLRPYFKRSIFRVKGSPKGCSSVGLVDMVLPAVAWEMLSLDGDCPVVSLLTASAIIIGVVLSYAVRRALGNKNNNAMPCSLQGRGGPTLGSLLMHALLLFRIGRYMLTPSILHTEAVTISRGSFWYFCLGGTVSTSKDVAPLAALARPLSREPSMSLLRSRKSDRISEKCD